MDHRGSRPSLVDGIPVRTEVSTDHSVLVVGQDALRERRRSGFQGLAQE